MNSVGMSAVDSYLIDVVSRYSSSSITNAAQQLSALLPHVHTWANGYEYELKLSGSYAKGTSVIGTTDVDLFISLHPSVSSCNTLEDVFLTLRNRLTMAGYYPREQNVSLGIEHGSLHVDLVPGVKHHPQGHDHSLWKRKAQTWTKSNVDEHIQFVLRSQRSFDIRAIKIWRNLRGLEFPSFYLELSVIEALRGRALASNPSGNMIEVLNHLSGEFTERVVLDPANQNNRVSDDLTLAEKRAIRDAAASTLALTWNEVIW